MSFTITPYQLMYLLILTGMVSLIYVLVKHKRIKTAVGVGACVIALLIYSPVRMTTNTQQHNQHMDSRIHEQHQQTLQVLPPRVKTERQSYDDMLKSETQKLRNEE